MSALLEWSEFACVCVLVCRHLPCFPSQVCLHAPVCFLCSFLRLCFLFFCCGELIYLNLYSVSVAPLLCLSLYLFLCPQIHVILPPSLLVFPFFDRAVSFWSDPRWTIHVSTCFYDKASSSSPGGTERKKRRRRNGGLCLTRQTAAHTLKENVHAWTPEDFRFSNECVSVTSSSV